MTPGPVAIATGPGVTAPYWEISRPYQPTSKVVNPRVIGSTNPIWIDGDGDGRFTAARAYAAAIIRRTGGEAGKINTALNDHDAAVALHVTDLSRIHSGGTADKRRWTLPMLNGGGN